MKIPKCSFYNCNKEAVIYFKVRGKPKPLCAVHYFELKARRMKKKEEKEQKKIEKGGSR